MTAKTATAKSDIETILAEPKTVTINGIECTVRHMKTRELFAFLGVFTRTLGGEAARALADFQDKKGEELQGEILGLVMVCAPLAVDPLLDLTKQLVDPVEAEMNLELKAYLDNPEIDDLFVIVDAVLENEKDNLTELLGKAKTYMAKWSAMFKKRRGRRSST